MPPKRIATPRSGSIRPGRDALAMATNDDPTTADMSRQSRNDRTNQCTAIATTAYNGTNTPKDKTALRVSVARKPGYAVNVAANLVKGGDAAPQRLDVLPDL